jgi:hypothetical protein
MSRHKINHAICYVGSRLLIQSAYNSQNRAIDSTKQKPEGDAKDPNKTSVEHKANESHFSILSSISRRGEFSNVIGAQA